MSLFSLQERFDELEGERSIYLNRAELCSKLTLPWYIPPNGQKDMKLETPYQSTGAEGVTNLANRLVMVLMPPNRPLFRLRIARKVVAQYAGEQKAKLLTAIEAGLARIEKEVTGIIETLSDRTAVYSAILHLIIGGNVLLHILPDGIKVFPLRSYVCKRDPDGNVLLVIVKQSLSKETLPDGVRTKIAKHIKDTEKEADFSDTETYDLFTCIERVSNKWVVYQECEGVRVGEAGVYKLDLCPWLPLRLYRSEEEDYGRGYVEQYVGTLQSLETLTQALVEASAAAAKVIFLVHTTSTTKAEDLTKAANLSFVPGNKADIDTLQIEKYNDLQVAKAQIAEFKQDIAKVFLMHTSIQRNAERVTAEEIRYMAQELETALGGLYSVLGKEFQRPYITLRIHYLQKKGTIDKFEKGIKPETVTGVDALGRGQDVTALLEYAKAVAATMPQMAEKYINGQSFLKALAAGMGIDDSVILKSDEQLAAEQEAAQQAQQEQMLGSAIPNMVNAGGKMLEKSMNNDGGNT